MIIAQQKRHENIAEYLLYMWQVEDMLRACNLDMEVVNRTLVDRYEVNPDTKQKISDWYESLLLMMRHEDLKDKGHLQINDNLLHQLQELHAMLLKSDKFPEYTADYYRTLPYIVELRSTMPEQERTDEIETCFNALYGVLLLKLQGKEIATGTLLAISQISHFLGLLAAYYKKDEERPLFAED